MLSELPHLQLHDAAACDHHVIGFAHGSSGMNFWLGALTVLGVACSAPNGDRLTLPLEDGGDAQAAIVSTGVSVILIYPPSECFTCSSDLAHWMELRRRAVATVAVVLSRSPDSSERRMLKRLRIPVAGVLRSPRGGKWTRGSGAYVFNNGTLVMEVLGARPGERAMALAAAESLATSASGTK